MWRKSNEVIEVDSDNEDELNKPDISRTEIRVTNPLTRIHKQPLLHLVTATFVTDMVLYISYNVYISSSPDHMQYEIVYCSGHCHTGLK